MQGQHASTYSGRWNTSANAQMRPRHTRALHKCSTAVIKLHANCRKIFMRRRFVFLNVGV
eukprot:scaffold94435_cov33-Prasinocladus_malaysianus.AAC.2